MGIEKGTEGLRSIGLAIIAMAAAITGLVVGKSFLVPLAIAILLWNLLEAVIDNYSRLALGSLHVPRAIATLLGIATIVLGLYLIATVLLGQSDALAKAWPRYVGRWEAMIGDLTQWLGPVRSAKIRQLMAEVDLKQMVPGLLSSAQSFLTGLLLVIAYVGFLLAEGKHLPAKLAAMASGPDEAARTGAVLGAISGSIRRYIGIKAVVSAMTGILSYAVLKFMGIDFAETWAILIFVLNFIPNIGSTIAVAFPAAIALVQFDTLTPFYTLVVALTVLQVLIGSILEPVLMGSSLNMSPFAIVLSLVFWGHLWGIVGMFLSVPIMVLTMIVCYHIPSWRWISVMLSSDGSIKI